MSHANARLTPRGRLILVERIADGWPVSRAAHAAGISRQTGSKWWHRYRAEGGLVCWTGPAAAASGSAAPGRWLRSCAACAANAGSGRTARRQS